MRTSLKDKYENIDLDGSGEIDQDELSMQLENNASFTDNIFRLLMRMVPAL